MLSASVMMAFSPSRISNNFFILLISTLTITLHCSSDPRLSGNSQTNIYWIIQNEIKIYKNIFIQNQRKKKEN